MAKTSALASAETVKRAVFEHVAECRKSMQEGRANLSGLEPLVQAYCQAVAALPKEQGQEHAKDLEELMRDITALGEELVQAREAVRRELSGLGRLKQANVAYHKTDAINPAFRRKQEDD